MSRFIQTAVGDYINLSMVKRVVKKPRDARSLYDCVLISEDGENLGSANSGYFDRNNDTFIPDTKNTTAVILTINDEDNVLLGIDVERTPVIAWKIDRDYDTIQPEPILMESLTSNQILLIEDVGGGLRSLNDITFQSLDEAIVYYKESYQNERKTK